MGKSTVISDKTKVLFLQKSTAATPAVRERVRNEIIVLNMPLVTTVLRRYIPYTEDQFQVGCIGLIKAVDSYEISREVPFSSYACFVIEREIHMDYHRRVSTIEGRLKDRLVSLDTPVQLDNGDEMSLSDVLEDESAQEELNEFISENQLQYICDCIIRPAIDSAVKNAHQGGCKANIEVWKELEFRYVMALIWEDSQKQRFNLSQMARECGLSVPNVRTKHLRTMNAIFQEMWTYMKTPYSELLERIRGKCKIPKRLLCLDPGKTTGWCLFVDGVLQSWGQLEDCYDDKNIDAAGLTELLKTTNPDFVCYEDYRVYSHKLARHTYSPVMTVRLIGVIEAYCQLNNTPAHTQMAVTAKGFCTDEKLQCWGFWQEGMRHARDAIRHGCYFLLFYKKGQDII